MKIAEIINELDQSDGPNRWIDARIDALFRFGSAKMRQPGYEWAWKNFPTWAAHKQARGMCGVKHDNGDLGLVWDSPEFTCSVDAAIALAEMVLPGEPVIMGWKQTSETLNWARVGKWDTPDATGATPALALTIAILRGKQAQEVEA